MKFNIHSRSDREDFLNLLIKRIVGERDREEVGVHFWIILEKKETTNKTKLKK